MTTPRSVILPKLKLSGRPKDYIEREMAINKKICGYTANQPIIPLDLQEIIDQKKREEEEKAAK